MITRLLVCLILGITLARAASFNQNGVRKSNDDVEQRPGHSQAYVSLLYSDSFVLGLRVLGQSLRETGTERDLVVIVAGNISAVNLATLHIDGWKLHHVEAVQNPGKWSQNGGKGFPGRFWGVYTKLLIFNLTEYERVVYLDADTIAARNLDDLFNCDGFCAVLRHSERFNSGIMVLEPSEKTINDMLTRIRSTPSYTGGDQGFLNEYFSELPGAPIYDPESGKTLSQTFPSWKDASGRRLARLSTMYNADLGLFIANSNRWMIPVDRIAVIHYTLGLFKPWQWYSSWILGENGEKWNHLRMRLPGSADGTTQGLDPQSRMARGIGLVAPWMLAALLVRRWCWRQGLCACFKFCTGSGGEGTSPMKLGPMRSPGRDSRAERPAVALPFGFNALAGVAGAISFWLAVYLAVTFVVPPQIQSRLGWTLAYEWIFLVTVVVFSQHLRLCHLWGQRRSAVAVFPRHLVGSKKDDAVFLCGRRPWAESVAMCSILIVTLGMLPWWTDVLGVASFTNKVLGTAAAAAVSTAVCLQCFTVLAGMWFLCGALEGPASSLSQLTLPLTKE